jgi:hypothetical protein
MGLACREEYSGVLDGTVLGRPQQQQLLTSKYVSQGLFGTLLAGCFRAMPRQAESANRGPRLRPALAGKHNVMRTLTTTDACTVLGDKAPATLMHLVSQRRAVS